MRLANDNPRAIAAITSWTAAPLPEPKNAGRFSSFILVGTYCQSCRGPLLILSTCGRVCRSEESDSVSVSGNGAAVQDVIAAMAAGIVVREAAFPGRAPIDAYGNVVPLRWHVASRLHPVPAVGVHGWQPHDPLRRKISNACLPRGGDRNPVVGAGREPKPRRLSCASFFRTHIYRSTRCRQGPAVRPTTCSRGGSGRSGGPVRR